MWRSRAATRMIGRDQSFARRFSTAKMTGATVVIAKLDRLARDAHFLLGLQKAGVRFVAADMPEANEMVVGIMAVIVRANAE